MNQPTTRQEREREREGRNEIKLTNKIVSSN